MDERPKTRRGFAGMSPEKRRASASKGGKSVKAENRAFARNKDLASLAGAKSRKPKRKSPPKVDVTPPEYSGPFLIRVKIGGEELLIIYERTRLVLSAVEEHVQRTLKLLGRNLEGKWDMEISGRKGRVATLQGTD